MMSDVPSVQIDDFENTPIFPNRGKIGSVVEASLSFPSGQGTMAAQPSNGFLHHAI